MAIQTVLPSPVYCSSKWISVELNNACEMVDETFRPADVSGGAVFLGNQCASSLPQHVILMWLWR